MDTSFSSRDCDELMALGSEFLRGASLKTDVTTMLLLAGYSDTEHQKGCSLFLEMLEHRKKAPLQIASPLVQIEQFAESSFSRATAVLIRSHPEQYDYLFGDGLAPRPGIAAVDYVQAFLERIADLRDGAGGSRVRQRASDLSALRALEGHHVVGLGIEGELRQLIEMARQHGANAEQEQNWVLGESLNEAARQFDGWLRKWQSLLATAAHRRVVRTPFVRASGSRTLEQLSLDLAFCGER